MAQNAPKPGRRASPPRVKPQPPQNFKNRSWQDKLKSRNGGNGAGANSRTLNKKEVVSQEDNTSLYEVVKPGRVMDMSPEGKVKRQKAFLEAFMERGTITGGCKAAGVSQTTFYWWLDNDPNFLEAYTSGVEVVADELEEQLYSRAKEKSDILGIFLLKGMRPKYRDNYKPGGSNGKPEEAEEKERTASSIVRSKLDALKRRKGGSDASAEGLQSQIAQARLRGKVADEEDEDL